MGNEDKFAEKYYQYLYPITQAARIKHIKAGFAFGLSQCLLYSVFAGLFYFGGLLIEDSFDAATNTYGINPEDIFIAMFAIFFGASQAGTAMSLGPDIGKAQISAKNVFRII
jgi:ATP-binding cassette subfamily B (MDR/TAP) protein 1